MSSNQNPSWIAPMPGKNVLSFFEGKPGYSDAVIISARCSIFCRSLQDAANALDDMFGGER